jgi:hypothetical protein
MNVEVDALREWARVLDRLTPLDVPASPTGLPGALAGRQTSSHRALVAAVDRLDREIAWLRDSVLAAVRSYEDVEDRAARSLDG